jgi:hypothetical protein
MAIKMTGNGLLVVLSLLVLYCPMVTAQVDDFSKEEADYFRSQKIYPLVAHEQDGDYPRSTYLIPHDITVPRGKVLTLYPGSTLLFKKDTRLIVKGKIIAKGKDRNPVLFCKLDNSDYYTPVDSMVDTKWDGIFVEDSGRIEFQYAHVTDSKYGISLSGPVGDIVLDSVQFYENRYQNLKVGKKEVKVTPYQYLFYQTSGNVDGGKLNLDMQDSIKNNPELIKKKPETPENVRRFRAVTWTGLVVGAVAGTGGYFLFNWAYYKEYNNIHELGNEKAIKKYRILTRAGEGLMYGGFGVAGCSLIGLTISLAF